MEQTTRKTLEERNDAYLQLSETQKQIIRDLSKKLHELVSADEEEVGQKNIINYLT